LVAAKVDSNKLTEVAAFISSHPGVTHNYERKNEFNLWFTLTIPEEVDFDKTLSVFSKKEGIEKIMSLPRVQTFKIRVAFDLTGESVVKAEKRRHKTGEPKIDRTKFLKVVKSLQTTLPLVEKPFSEIASEAGIAENEILDIINELYDYGIIRRFPAMTRHKKIGFTHNALIVLKVNDARINEAGKKLAEFSCITHCYERKTYPHWQYNLYAMTHAKDSQESSENLQKIINIAKSDDHLVLESLREYKKTRVIYFDPALDEWNLKYLK